MVFLRPPVAMPFLRRLPDLVLALVLVALSAPTALAEHPIPDHRITEDPIQLEVFFPNWYGFPYDTNWPVERRAAELTGVSLVSIEMGPKVSSREVVDHLVRSGNLPDIVGGARLRPFFDKYGPQGAFLKLDLLIEDHAPNLHAFFEENPELYTAAQASDGHLYYIPFFPDGVVSTGYFVRQDWLDRLGLETPQTVDDFHAMLTAFKTGDPNGNAEADEIPLFTPNLGYLLRLAPLWGVRSSGSTSEPDFYLEGNELVHGLSHPRFKEAVRNLAQWYREGLVEFDPLEDSDKTEISVHAENVVGATHGWFDKIAAFNDLLSDEIAGFRLLPILPPITASGQRATVPSRDRLTSDGWAISFTNPFPVETIKYFDFWFSETGRRLNNYGLEGVHYTMVDGKPVISPDLFEQSASVRRILREAGALAPRGVRIDYDFEWQWINEIGRRGIVEYLRGGVLIDSALPLSLNAGEQRMVDVYWAPIKAHMLEQTEAWIIGDGDVDEEWDAHLSKLTSLGYERVSEALNTARWRQLYGP